MQWDDRETNLAIIDKDANVSSLAAIGFAGEWRGESSSFPARIEQNATVSEFARVQAGVCGETVVGAGAFIMAGAHIGHDAVVGMSVDVCPNAVVCGLATVEHHAKIYSGAVIAQHRTVGHHAIIAANSVVTKDIPPGEVWGGAPARFIRMREGFTKEAI